jgi:hypothetical protein
VMKQGNFSTGNESLAFKGTFGVGAVFRRQPLSAVARVCGNYSRSEDYSSFTNYFSNILKVRYYCLL